MNKGIKIGFFVANVFVVAALSFQKPENFLVLYLSTVVGLLISGYLGLKK